VTAEVNRTAATVIKLLEHLGHGYTVWMDKNGYIKMSKCDNKLMLNCPADCSGPYTLMTHIL
jgi:hypothetical protein